MAINIVTSTKSLSVPEGGNASFTVRLASRPSRTTTVSVTRASGDSDIRVASGASLSFTRDNWYRTKTVTLSAAADSDKVAGQAVFSLSGSGLNRTSVTAKEVEKITTPAALKLSVTTLQVPEGGTANFTVVLSAAPAANVTVNVARASGDSSLSVAQGASRTFTQTNWMTPQTVTLAAANDADSTAGQAVFTASASGYASASLTASEVESALGAIVPSSATLDVPEGGHATFTVRLGQAPSAGVTVAVARTSGDADLNVTAGASLTFTTANWNTPQTVTLAATADADALAGQSVFTLSAAGFAPVNVTAKEVEPGATSGRVVIDPVTRIEGHLRFELEVSGGKVAKAWSSVTLYRGIEQILAGRSPLDAPIMTQRLCGVCTYIHAHCSARAIEDAVNLAIPDNARIVRNLILGAQFLHDHPVHFYQLHGLDWVDISKALTAAPAEAVLAARILAPNAPAIDYAAVQTRLKALVDSGNLGPFGNSPFGHSAMRLTPEENLIVVAHYLEALKLQVKAAKMMAILGGKNPHPQSTVVGGVTCGGELNATRLNAFKAYLDEVKAFVADVYLPGVRLVAGRYPEWAELGGFDNFLAYGEFPETATEPAGLFLPRGIILGRDLSRVLPVDTARITEDVTRGWYAAGPALNPTVGKTQPVWSSHDVDQHYSWSKAPRYDAQAMEVGPLARVLVAYAAGQRDIKAEVDDFLESTGLTADHLFSTLGRTAARAIETKAIGEAMSRWITTLEQNLSSGKRQIFSSYSIPQTGTGEALNEAPRGALGHWINIGSSKIGNYQMVVPSTWNFGPRDASGVAGPVEQALIGVPVADPQNPVEILRVIHSFDPCVACGVHLIEKETGRETHVKVI